ncbi:MAG: hypothetical protein KDE33_28295, partial [Bacteroidetes bacterium]|nr:hypothetical protein [Bacteroidota bacterium]
MKKQLTFFVLLFAISIQLVGQNTITINNSTDQRIVQLEYWLGAENQVLSPSNVFKAKGMVEKDNKNFVINESFHKKKRNALKIRAHLAGGGYVQTQYNISKGEKNASITLFNIAQAVPTDNFKTVIDKFKELSFDKEYLKLTNQNALLSTLGSLILVDSEEKNILYKITPKELKAQLTDLCQHSNSDYAMGVFSSATSIQGELKLPFVNLNAAFVNGDVSKFTWTIENVGECVWAPENDKDLATLFSELSEKTKDVLLQEYKDHPGSKLKFINKAFLIGRIEVETENSRKIQNNTEISASTFATAKGNYTFENSFSTKNLVGNVVTKVEGYYVTGLLANLYLLRIAKATEQATADENGRIKSEFDF